MKIDKQLINEAIKDWLISEEYGSHLLHGVSFIEELIENDK